MNHLSMTLARRLLAATALTPLVLTAAACSGSSHTTHSAGASATTTSASTMAAALQAHDTWAKAADSGMSAAFGHFTNSGSKPVTMTKVSGNHGPMQLHVTTKTADGNMEMKETSSFTLPAGGSLELKPGGNHMMFMDLSKPLKAGDTDKLTVTFQDGSTKNLDVPVRAYEGAKEKYAPEGGSDHSSMAGMSDMSDMSGHGTH